MALNLETVGHKTAPAVHEYAWRDVALYALGVGATRDTDLDFLYEGRGPKVLPTYVAVPIFEVFDAMLRLVKGDLIGVVHGSQTLHFHKALEPAGTLSTVGSVQGVYDLKRMATAVFGFETRDAAGDVVAEAEAQVVFLNEGDFGGERPPKPSRVEIPDRPPDIRATEKTHAEQALLYRLSSDLNPLHADPEASKELGFELPILHGLATFGIIGRAVLRELCHQDPARLKSLRGQFRAPVWPGDTLVIEGWKDTGGYALRASTEQHPTDLCFTNALAVVE